MIAHKEHRIANFLFGMYKKKHDFSLYSGTAVRVTVLSVCVWKSKKNKVMCCCLAIICHSLATTPTFSAWLNVTIRLTIAMATSANDTSKLERSLVFQFLLLLV
jgi:hypothetical protein